MSNSNILWYFRHLREVFFDMAIANYLLSQPFLTNHFLGVLKPLGKCSTTVTLSRNTVVYRSTWTTVRGHSAALALGCSEVYRALAGLLKMCNFILNQVSPFCMIFFHYTTCHFGTGKCKYKNETFHSHHGRIGERHAHSLYAVSPEFESRPSYNLSSWCFTGRVIHQCVCR